MKENIKKSFRRLYKAIPLKKLLFEIIRKVGKPPRKIWQHFYFHGPFNFKFKGHRIKFHNYNSLIETALFWTNTFPEENFSLELWTVLSRKSKYIFDIGANSGLFSVIAKKINPSAEVFAFEPIPRFYAKLENNIKVNKLEVHPVMKAISNKDGKTQIFDLPVDHHYHASLKRSEVNHFDDIFSFEIEASRLDSFFYKQKLEGIDLIKIDVEGFEVEVFESIGNLIEKFRPSILVELRSAENGGKIEKLIENLGYSFFDIDEKNGGIIEIEHLKRPIKWNLLLLSKKHKDEVLRFL